MARYEGRNDVQFVFVYQREPHARQLAFADIHQPVNLGERCELARSTCDEMALDPAGVWIDGMDDQSRALFGDLASPAILIDPFGVIRTKSPWAEPDAIEQSLNTLLSDVGLEVERRQIFAEPAGAASKPDPRDVGAALYLVRRGDEMPASASRQPAAVWAAAVGVVPPVEKAARLPESWLGLVAAATLVAERPRDARWRAWIDRLRAAPAMPIRHWALELLHADLRRRGEADAVAVAIELDELRREQPWLYAVPR